MCGYFGEFLPFGRPLRIDAECPNCKSLERHRLFFWAVENDLIEGWKNSDATVIHFAAEPILRDTFGKYFKSYKTADLYFDADLKLDIQKMDIKSNSVDIVIANHVLEHVNDVLAANEICRVLKPGGLFLCQVPIIEGWATTYENLEACSATQRWLHHGQGDHLRYYGRDFRSIFSDNPVSLVNEVTAEGPEVVEFGLLRGEKLFIFKKQSP